MKPNFCKPSMVVETYYLCAWKNAATPEPRHDNECGFYVPESDEDDECKYKRSHKGLLMCSNQKAKEAIGTYVDTL